MHSKNYKNWLEVAKVRNNGNNNEANVLDANVRPGHTKIFIFRTEKKCEISGHFSGHQSHKKTRFFVISGAYNFGTFRAEAKITTRRHEVVYRLSSERKMIDLE